MSDFMLGKDPLPEKPKCNHEVSLIKHNLYVCNKCREPFDELSANHHGLIGKGFLLKTILKREREK